MHAGEAEATSQIRRPIIPYYEKDEEVRSAESNVEAFLNCARYNDEGDAELLQECLNEHPECIHLTDQQGRTAIHMAAANNHTKLLEILMTYHPEPDKCNFEGNTALHFAALNNAVEACKILLNNNWNSSIRNSFGKTPLQLIQGKEYELLEALLVEHDKSLDIDAAHETAEIENDVKHSNNLSSEHVDNNSDVSVEQSKEINREYIAEEVINYDIHGTVRANEVKEIENSCVIGNAVQDINTKKAITNLQNNNGSQISNTCKRMKGEEEKHVVRWKTTVDSDNEELPEKCLPTTTTAKGNQHLYFGSINMDEVE